MTNLSSRSAGVLFSNAAPSSSSAQPGTLSALADMLATHQATQGPAPLSALAPNPSAPAPPPARHPAPTTRVAPRQNLRHVIIKQQVQVLLDLQRPTYTMWRRLFTVTLGQFGALDHIDGDLEPLHDDPEWVQDDYTIVSWLYTTVSEEILSLILAPDDTAFAVWRRIENLFLDNAVTRAVYLDDEFHGQRQGNMNISAYCSRLKSLADRLRDLGRNVTDADLVHRVLAGLRSDFRHAVTTLSRERPLPSFQDVRSFLVLEESRRDDDDTAPAGAALHAAAPPTQGQGAPAPPPAPTPPSPQPPAQPPAQPNKNKNGGNWNRNKNKSAAPAVTAPQPAPTAQHPWTGMVQAWPYQWRPHYPGASILGPVPRPAAPPPPLPFAGTAQLLPAAAPVFQAPPAAPAPCWDQAGLIHALQQLSLQQQQPAGGEWIMDTGATSHMTSASGPAYPGGASPM